MNIKKHITNKMYKFLVKLVGKNAIFQKGRPRAASSPANRNIRGIRNNNPLNIEFNKNNDWIGQLGSDGRFVIFSEQKYGFRAGARVLRSYQRRGIDTISGIVHVFAPNHENNSEHYARMVAQWSGYGLTQKLDFNDSKTITRIIQAMARMEVGYQYSFDEVKAGVDLA